MAGSEFSFGDIAPRSKPKESFAQSYARESEASATLDDTALLQAIERGEQSAITTLFDRYSRLVYAVTLRVLRDPVATEDVLHDIFAQVWRKPENFSAAAESLGGWLAVLARNRSIDILRRNTPSEITENTAVVPPFHATNEQEREALLERAHTSLQKLPAEQKKVLEMAFFDGLAHAEIAELTGSPLNAVKARIRTGLLYMRKAVQA